MTTPATTGPASAAYAAPPPASPAEPAPLAPALAWLVGRAALDAEARAAASRAVPGVLAAGAADPGALAHALIRAERPADALRLMACALPPREGIWWAWVAARHAVQHATARASGPAPDDGDPPLPPSAAEVATLDALERWIASPTDELRRAAWARAEQAGVDTPAGCAAVAAYFTGGSLAPAGGPYVPPPPGVHCVMAGTAATIAAVRTDPLRLGELATAFVAQGVEIVRQLGGWEPALGLAKEAFDAQARQHEDASRPPAR